MFCTNAINIYAGINGLECGQAYVIGAAILLLQLIESSDLSSSLSHAHTQAQGLREEQLFALTMVLPFLGACLSLLRFNWFPVRVFVGDTFW